MNYIVFVFTIVCLTFNCARLDLVKFSVLTKCKYVYFNFKLSLSCDNLMYIFVSFLYIVEKSTTLLLNKHFCFNLFAFLLFLYTSICTIVCIYCYRICVVMPFSNSDFLIWGLKFGIRHPQDMCRALLL